MENPQGSYIAHLTWFNKQFRIRAKYLMYLILIPAVTIVLVNTLELGALQRKYFLVVVLIAVAVAIVQTIMIPRLLMRKLKDYLIRRDNGEVISEEEMTSIRKNFSLLPLRLALDSASRWAFGIFLCAMGLWVLGTLAISTQVTFILVGCSAALLGFLIYFIVASRLLRVIAPRTVFEGINTKNFVLNNKLSVSLSVIIVVIILLLASTLTTIVYTLTNISMTRAYQNQMTNINATLVEVVHCTYANLEHESAVIAANESVIEACAKGKFGPIEPFLRKNVETARYYESLFIAA
ncbi:MAG TPA: hypothetical protein VF857_03990, partial [Spirochaetota bacterium]